MLIDQSVEAAMSKWVRMGTLAGLVALSIPVLGSLGGCTGADQPKLADAPKFDPGPPQPPPKIPGQKKAFTEVPGYSKYMSGPGTTK